MNSLHLISWQSVHLLRHFTSNHKGESHGGARVKVIRVHPLGAMKCMMHIMQKCI